MKNRKRNRMKGFDYSSDNLYFVTICVQDRLCYFGDIDEGTGRDLSVHNPNILNKIIKLNAFGIIVKERLCWLEKQYPYVVLHSHVIMPNQVHAIIEIDSLNVLDKSIKIKLLSSLIGALKTTSSKLIHEAGFLDFSCHRSFHDHIIRTQNAYQNISNYIAMNPQKW
jgi:REP element-mobilizing transposase RayT